MDTDAESGLNQDESMADPEVTVAEEETPEEEEHWSVFDTRTTPPYGWKYRDPDTRYTVHGNNEIDLLDKVVSHRTANNLPDDPSDVRRDIHDQICKRIGYNPEWCELAVDYREGKSIRGPGDLVAKALNLPGVRHIRKAVVATYQTGSPTGNKPTRRPCGCGGRQKRLNAKRKKS